MWAEGKDLPCDDGWLYVVQGQGQLSSAHHVEERGLKEWGSTIVTELNFPILALSISLLSILWPPYPRPQMTGLP